MVKKIKKQLSRSVQTKVNVNLSSDIVESNILTRLPVKTLIRFRAVSKSWYSLISDPVFINMHNQIQKKKNNLLLIEYPHENGIVITDSYSKEKYSSLNDTRKKPYHHLNVVGCCNGIVCVFGTYIFPQPCVYAAESHIILWNPALRINKIVCRYRVSSLAPPTPCFGFGYHDQTNDYKVIRFTDGYCKQEDVEIYSLNLDSWRKIELGAKDKLIEDYIVKKRFGVYVSCYRGGAYFWLTQKSINRQISEARIISFDMEEEIFKEIMLPNTSDHDHHRENSYALFIYKDSLALFHTQSDAFFKPSYKIFYIWVMKEYKHPKSYWTMLCKFDPERPWVKFLGNVRNEIILKLWGYFGSETTISYFIEEVDVFDIDKSEMKRRSSTKDIRNLTKTMWVSSFNESLISFT